MSKTKIVLGKHVIGDDSPCFIIAEIGHNHQGSLETAKKLIDAAAESGAHAVKLQKRNNKELFTKELYNSLYDNENSFGLTYGEHREFLEFGKKEYKTLKRYAEKKGLVFMSTAFDIHSVDFLEEIEIPAYKIASADIDNIPLIEYIASKGKPVFISTGASSIQDVDRAYDILKKAKIPFCIMHCTAAYPMFDYEEANLKVIKTYRTRYPDAVIGFSGHESGIVLPVIAYILGAKVVEKHFTLNRAFKGTDHHYSLEPQGFRKMARDLERVNLSLGDGEKRIYESEKKAKIKMGKSLVTLEAINKGEIITKDKLGVRSPSMGLSPSKLNELIGRCAKTDILKDSFITLQDIE
ncbi:N-acetylneuraminate synthase family protein [bacterium]